MTAVTIPDGITKISDNAFCLCESLEKVNISKTVKSIGSAAFMDCAITEIEFPESVTEIKEAAFAGCNYIQKAVLPSGVKELKYRTFANCGSLSEVILPNTLESIGKQNFSGCTSLKEIVVPENVLSIDLCNFSDDYDSNSDCSSLKHIAFLGEGTKVECCTRGDVVINDIYGHKGSFAEKFANDRRIKFVSIDDTAIPFIESATKNSVTLKPVAGYQYSLDKVNWQNSNVFKQLRLNTLYTVYQRKQESGISNLEFIPFSVTFKILEAAPALIESVAGNSVTLKPVAGYQYSVDKVNWQTSNVFTNLYSGYQYTFYQRVNFKETITYISEPSEGVTVTTTPDSPTVEDAFETKIILKKYEGYEYSLGGEIWKSSNVFDGLEPGKSYDFYQRIAETASCAASPKSDPLNVRTVKLANNTKVSVPTILKMVGNSVTLTPTDGYEYSLDGVHWQKNNVFSNLKVGSYLFYQRIAETETKRASAASKALEVYISSQKCKECSGVGIATVTIQCVDCKNGVTGYEKCSRCGGSGGYGPGTRQTCTICSGKGTMLDGFGKTITCFLCKGDGYVYTYPTCSKCGGSGRGPAIECLTCSGKGTISKTGPCENCKGSGFVNVFYLSFNANGGSNAPQKIKIEGYNSKIPNEKPVRTGYTFVGWNSLNDDVAIYQPGDCYAGVEDTLYAMWAKNCTHCNSTGRVTITERRQCSRCDGEGYVRKCNNCGSTRIIHRIYGWGSYYECDNCKSISISREKCANCSGGYYKETYERNCADCSGVGYIQESAPTILEYTDTKVVLAAKTGYEYSKDGKNYQSSNVFNELLCGTEYTFYQRYKETKVNYAGPSSAGAKFKTEKGLRNTPSAPVLLSKTHNRVVLQQKNGYEYSMDGITWQKSNVFSGLNPETNYLFYQRTAETEQYYASEISTSLTVRTNEKPVYIAGDLDGNEIVSDADAVYLLMHIFFPSDYPIEQPCDFNGDGVVSDADAIYLLMFTFFPNDYPIN